jgi:hypothetical protein
VADQHGAVIGGRPARRISWTRRSPSPRRSSRILQASLIQAASLMLAAGMATAQEPVRVVPGWGVDTTGGGAWTDDGAAVRAIYERWATYLRSNPRAQAPTPLWSAAEQARWTNYDLTASIAYQGMPATVVDIRPAGPEGAPGEYVVKTLFATAVGAAREIKPIALTRVYAVREGGAWVFSNALERVTQGWREETVGPIRYVIEPGYAFDPERARAAVTFADSVAAAYGVPALDSLTYYLTSSPDQVHRLRGVDWTFGSVGYGYASAANRMILTGNPAVGEAYRHELVHVLLQPLHAAGRTHGIIAEGIATWLGGSLGHDFPTLMREYAAFLRDRPEITLDAVLTEQGGLDLGARPAGALLTMMVHEAGGVAAVKTLLESGRSMDDLRTALMRLLGTDWTEIGSQWRRRVLAFAAPPQSARGAR